MLRFVFALSFFLLPTFAAELPPVPCDLSFHTAAGGLTPAEALLVVGEGPAKERYQAAMKAALPHPFHDAAQMNAYLESLFNAVKAGGKWEYRRVPLADGSTVYLGSLGHGLLVEPSGKITSGMFPMRLFKDGIWKPGYEIEDRKTLRQGL